MTCPTWTRWRARLLLTGISAAIAFAGLATLTPPAQAFWIGFGAPYPGYYGPAPYWGYPPPYAYAPAPYPYYPPPAYYPPAAGPAPTAYAPQSAPPAMTDYAPEPSAPAPTAYAPQSAAPAASATATTDLPKITYTSKPAFTNAAGQTCREYKAASGRQDVFGTACRQADGQWRVVN